jgi:hypothetical protein
MKQASGPNRSFTAGLIEALYALDEPWRERFLVLAANLVTGWQWGEDEPDWGELAVWLEESLVLQRLTTP